MSEEIQDRKNLEYYAKILEIHPEEDENIDHFRVRLANGILKEYGDVMLATEILLGKDYHNFNKEDQALAFMVMQKFSKIKELNYILQCDSYFRIPFKDFEHILTRENFDKVYSYDFKDKYHNRLEEYAIWIEKENALFLTLESYNGKKTVNSTELYYELELPQEKEENDYFSHYSLRNLLDHASHGPLEDENGQVNSLYVQVDVREGLVKHLNKIRTSGIKTNNPWKYFEQHNLWLCDFSETKKRNYDYKKIRKRKIEALPLDVQIMTGYSLKIINGGNENANY